MSNNRIGNGSSCTRGTIKLTPMTRAVRSALAASALALALGTTSGAMAATVPVPEWHLLQRAGGAIDMAPVFDLTVVAQAIDISDAGDVVIDNGDAISVFEAGDANAIRGYSTGAGVSIDNVDTGVLEAISLGGNAIGIYGYATGDVGIDNAADITVNAYAGLADGIFASGANVVVSSSGDISATGADWAAGVEAQGGNSVSVHNQGGIYAVAGNKAFGLNASGGAIDVINAGSIEVHGYYATGIDVQAQGDAGVDNSGSIVAGIALGGGNFSAALGTGINVAGNGEGIEVSVVNDGSIDAAGAFGGTGISAVASGVDGSVSVSNAGTIDAVQGAINGYGAYGVVASGDAGADINSSGDVTATSGGLAIGLSSMAFNGVASVTNSGSVTATSTAVNAKATATGINAFSSNGDVVVENTGTTYANGVAKATAVYALASTGDVDISSGADGEIGFYSWGGRGFGVLAIAAQGDLDADNAGSITGYSYDQAAGIFGVASAGDADIDNSGSINVVSGGGTAVGAFARADYGTASISNSGDITASVGSDNYAGKAAYAVLARGAYANATNGGDIVANGYLYATGIAVSSTEGTTVEGTGGSIVAYALGAASGIDARSTAGDVAVTNASSIEATGLVLGAHGIRSHAADGDVVIDNSAEITAGSVNGDAIGIYGYSLSGDVEVDNLGDITAVSSNGLADGIFASGGNVDISNGGTVQVSGSTWAAGIEAQGANATDVHNTGDILAVAVGANGSAFGLYATGSDVGLTSSGSIEAQGYYATGIEAQSFGGISIDNDGSIIAGYANGSGGYYSALATGINASTGGTGAAVGITSSGDVSATGFYGATGISAVSSGEGGTASVSSSGSIHAIQGTKYGYGAYGVFVSADDDASIDVGGSVSATSAGAASGVSALSFAGDAKVTNAGDITATSTAMGYYGATGILAFGANGTATVQNSGSVTATAAGMVNSEARAIDAQALGDVGVTNAGSLYADGEKYAFGVYAVSGAGELSVSNVASGEIGFHSYSGRGWGVFGLATQGDVDISNAGSVSGYAYGQSVGLFAVAGAGDATVSNSGDIDVTSAGSAAVGVFSRANAGTSAISNSGDIAAVSGYAAYGATARGADVTISNSGDIDAAGAVVSVGAYASGSNSATVSNSGTIHAGGGSLNVGVLFGSGGGNVLNNSGTISADGVEGTAFAVMGGSAADTINNAGILRGVVSLGDGDDVFNNQAGGLWDVDATSSTSFGGGANSINNEAGGTIRLAGGILDLSGNAVGNAFHNAGALKIEGIGNLIALAGNPLPLVNDGTIDFGDGVTDDALTIVGNLSGHGAIGVDMDLVNNTSDQLFVAGNLVDGATQAVDVYITAMPESRSTAMVEFAQIAGDANAGSFVGGKMRGYSPSNFLDLHVVTAGQVDASNATVDRFMVGLEVAGLNDVGALAATAATGAAEFVNAQMGTFRQRLGVNPYGDAGKVMNAFVRIHSSEGDVSPSHVAFNFGQGGDFGFKLSSWGRELGINANFSDTLHAGLVFDKADGKQRLKAGVGENRLKGTAVGGYVTWYVPNGWYVDLSTRSMVVDVDATTVAGTTRSSVRTRAASVEAGYEWQLAGFNLVPQLQFVHTKLEAMDAIRGELAEFRNHAGTWTRGRLGLEANKTLHMGDWRWTPYGSLNLVSVSDGKSTYTAAGNFHGMLNSKGNSVMAELGLGLQKGAFGFGLGLNWTDGGAYNSIVGAQASARFSW